MLKKNKGLVILTSLMILLPMVAGVLLWNQLPEKMPIHWGVNGQADGWCSRPMAVCGMPLLLLALHLLCMWGTGLDKRNRNHNEKVARLVLWIVPAVSLLANSATYTAALGRDFQMNRMVMLFVGLVFVIVGNYLPKTVQNRTIGIKIKWTLEDEENWNATHRLAGKLWMTGGLLIMLCAFLTGTVTTWIMSVALVMMVGIPVVYSWRLSRRQKG